MAYVCPHCGAANRPATLWCAFCRAPLHADTAAAESTARSGHSAVAPEARPVVSVTEAAEAAPSSEPQWRLELNRKVEELASLAG